MLRIIGCPRSGTNYTASYLVRNGYDVGWERWGSQGIVSWMAAMPSDQVPFGDGAWDGTPMRTWCVVRHPLHVIGSIQKVALSAQSRQRFSDYVEQWYKLPRKPLARAAWFYLMWSWLCLGQAERWYRVEDQSETLLAACKHWLVPNQRRKHSDPGPPSHTTHKVDYPSLSEVADAAGHAAAVHVRLLADRLGYGEL